MARSMGGTDGVMRIEAGLVQLEHDDHTASSWICPLKSFPSPHPVILRSLFAGRVVIAIERLEKPSHFDLCYFIGLPAGRIAP
jgi:hypothetical protein